MGALVRSIRLNADHDHFTGKFRGAAIIYCFVEN